MHLRTPVYTCECVHLYRLRMPRKQVWNTLHGVRLGNMDNLLFIRDQEFLYLQADKYLE